MKVIIIALLAISGFSSQQVDKTTRGNIKKLKIKSIQNTGQLQDDLECLNKDKGSDEITLDYESGGQKM
jgi:hypothetical protein